MLSQLQKFHLRNRVEFVPLFGLARKFDMRDQQLARAFCGVVIDWLFLHSVNPKSPSMSTASSGKSMLVMVFSDLDNSAASFLPDARALTE